MNEEKETKEQQAQAAAESWLVLVDAGQYGESWEMAASLFKGVITKEKWSQDLGPVRKPLGDLVSRKLSSKKYCTELPGAPDGEYVVLQFKTSFTQKKRAIETITPMLDKDGTWRVSGYFIK